MNYEEILEALRDKGYVGEVVGRSEGTDKLRVRAFDGKVIGWEELGDISAVLDFYGLDWRVTSKRAFPTVLEIEIF